MARMQAKAPLEERNDGLREKMISVKRVTKVVKGGRILGLAARTVVGDGEGGIGMVKARRKKSHRLFRKRWSKRAGICSKCREGMAHYSMKPQVNMGGQRGKWRLPKKA